MFACIVTARRQLPLTKIYSLRLNKSKMLIAIKDTKKFKPKGLTASVQLRMRLTSKTALKYHAARSIAILFSSQLSR